MRFGWKSGGETAQSTKRRRYGRSLAATLFVLSVVGVVANQAEAVHDTGIFQLDRNAQASVDNGSPAALHDWDQVCREKEPTLCTDSSVGASGASSKSFNVDPLGQTIFTGAQSGGSSKDPDLIAGWRHKAGSVPDKDELSHGFAARYSQAPDTTAPTLCPAGTNPSCDVVFFGADRFDTSGDSQIGFWFLQNRVGLNAAPAGGIGSFSGEHKDGDILVLSDFTQGGGTPNIKVLEWNFDPTPGKDPTDDGAIAGGGSGKCSGSGDGKTCDNLTLLGGGPAPADCIGPPVVGAGDGFCATVNNTTAVSPWPFLDKSGGTSFAPGEFYEGGINLSLLSDQIASECFSSFIVETRSAATPDAVLKDFVLGDFGNCSATLSTTASSSSVVPGQQVTDTATVIGSTPTHTPSGNITFTMCSFTTGSSDACDGSDAAHTGTQVGSAVALSGTGTTATAVSAAVNTAASPLAPGRYCFRATWPGDTNYTTALAHTSEPECFTVAKIDTQTVTTPVDGSGAAVTTVTLGATVMDRAVVTGTAAGGDPTGNVNFFVCAIATGTCDGTTNVGTAVSGNPKTLVSDGVANTYTSIATSGGYTPAAVGRYCFRAEYGGSTTYNPSSDSRTNECFVVTDTTSITSAQTWLPNDSATVTSGNGAPVAGTLAFTLYSGDNCGATSGAVIRTAESFTLNGTSSSETKTTNNSTVSVSTSSAVSWKVDFTSSNANVGNSTHCEKTSLTITN